MESLSLAYATKLHDLTFLERGVKGRRRSARGSQEAGRKQSAVLIERDQSEERRGKIPENLKRKKWGSTVRSSTFC
jgi:hypothetical protein